MIRRPQFQKKTLLAMLAVLLFSVLGAGTIYYQYSLKVKSIYLDRMVSGVENFSLNLSFRYQTLENSVSLYASDNAIKVMVRLEILPQLKHYLDRLSLGDNHGQNFKRQVYVFKKNTPLSQRSPILSITELAPSEDLSSLCQASGLHPFKQNLYMSAIEMIEDKGRNLGEICLISIISSTQFTKQLDKDLAVDYLIKDEGGQEFDWVSLIKPEKAPVFNGPSSLSESLDVFQEGEVMSYGYSRELNLGEKRYLISFNQPAALHPVHLVRSEIMPVLVLIFGLAFVVMVLVYFSRAIASRLAKTQATSRAVLNSIQEGVVSLDVDGSILRLNPKAEAFLFESQKDWKEAFVFSAFRCVDEKTLEPIEYPREQLSQGKSLSIASPVLLLMGEGQGPLHIHISFAPVFIEGELVGASLVIRNIEEEYLLHQEQIWRASHDELTKLLNVNALLSLMNCQIEQEDFEDNNRCLLYLNLDRFKVVNDNLGRLMGDKVIQDVVAILLDCLTPGSEVARVAGDEFAVLLSGNKETAKRFSKQVNEKLSQYDFSVEDKRFVVSVTAGATCVRKRTIEPRVYLVEASEMMKLAKRFGKSGLVFFDEQDEQPLSVHLVPELNAALKTDGFELYVQKVESFSHPEEFKYEVLLRFENQQGQFISPAVFIPVAERYGLAGDIDRWVVEKLFSEMASFYRDLAEQEVLTPPFSINLSANTLGDGTFLSFILEVLERYQIAPNLVAFEATETAVMSNVLMAERIMSELKALGCQFLLDDFGTGMSSFGYLKKFDFDILKMDGEFVKHILDSEKDLALVKSMIALANELGIKSLAEYVENDEIKAGLKVLGVDYGQGYGIEKPKPLVDLKRDLLL